MTEKTSVIEALQRALNDDWPEIQKHLIEQAAKDENTQIDERGREYHIDEHGRKILHLSFDSWWLDNYDRNGVILQLPGVSIMPTAAWNADAIISTLRSAYGVHRYENCVDCFSRDDILAHIERFPEGQFMAIRISGPLAGNAVGMAVTMRTSRPPTAPVLPWRQAIGGLRLGAHEQDGDWLYGAEMAVHPMFQGHGIGTGLYKVRFQLVKELNLRGWYAVGMLMGYSEHAEKMDVVEYGEKVIAGDIKDPTVSLQRKLGFRLEQLVTDYCDEPAAGDAGVLIVWENPDFQAGGTVK